MENSLQPTETNPLDNQSYLLFSIIDDEIKLNTNFKNYDDMIELLNVILNTNFVVESVLSDLNDGQKLKIIDDLRSMKRRAGPYITPLSISTSE